MVKKQQGGFALLMTLIVVTIVISIGLTVLDLSTKQVRLATNSRDSEVAFHAANAGMECARFWRRQSSAAMEGGSTISPTCFGSAPYTNTVTEITNGVSGDGDVYVYQYAFSWGGNTRCSQITALIGAATPGGSGLTIGNMTNLIVGFPSGNTKICAAGERCTVLSVRGYNRPCGQTTGYGTVQREVLLQF